MLELVRVLVASPRTRLDNDLVFLFNGAEEAILLASHAFITQHKWAPSVKVGKCSNRFLRPLEPNQIFQAFLNLEAAGSGGRELLFQSGPGNPWLVQSYIRSAVNCTSVLYCTVVYCSVVYCTVLYCTVMYCTVL